jgi:hypothetical protein
VKGGHQSFHCEPSLTTEIRAPSLLLAGSLPAPRLLPRSDSSCRDRSFTVDRRPPLLM